MGQGFIFVTYGLCIYSAADFTFALARGIIQKPICFGASRMRTLFRIDTKDYAEGGREYVRPSARAIIIEGGKVAMVHSRLYNYYKFPGGGIERGESRLDALVREVLEESGLSLDEGSIREYGEVHRRQRWDGADAEIFVQDNFYYLASAKDGILSQRLDAYEAQEGFALEWVEPETAIAINRLPGHGPKDKNMIEREARVLELLISEGHFGR